MDETDIYLDAAAKNLMIAMDYLDIAKTRIYQGYRGWDPPIDDNRAWDYLDAIDAADAAIAKHLKMWNNKNN